jgi:hypothetical protein
MGGGKEALMLMSEHISQIYAKRYYDIIRDDEIFFQPTKLEPLLDSEDSLAISHSTSSLFFQNTSCNELEDFATV